MVRASAKKGRMVGEESRGAQAVGSDQIRGGPLQLDISLIDEDPNQPRTMNNPGFSNASLAELAATISARGVKTPISVRDNPAVPGRYLINHGARRFRASKVAGRTTVPAFIDNDYNDADQVIENLQRNELTAREIADYIGRELAKGIKKGEVAKLIGKSAAFVSQHVTLLDLPGPVATAFNSARVRDVTVVNELVNCYKTMPDAVVAWLADETQDITRSAVKLLREFLDEKLRQDRSDDGVGDPFEEVPLAEHMPAQVGNSVATNTSGRIRTPVVRVLFNERPAQLLLHRRPHREGLAWIRCDDDTGELEAELSQVKLVALLDRQL